MVPESLDAHEHDAEGDDVSSIPELEGFMTATDASESLGLTRQSINKKIRANVFKGARRIGTQYILPIEAVEAEKQRRADLAEEAADDDEVVEG